MKYRMITRHVIRKAGDADYYVSECHDVQTRFLFFFWRTLKSFWQREYALKYLNACKEINNHNE